MNFEDWIKSQIEYEHLLRKYGDTIFIKHNGEYQRFELRLASKAFDKDKPKSTKDELTRDWVSESHINEALKLNNLG
jgi:hypothetical protein